MRAHTITTKARVGGRGRTKRTIAPRGIFALSLAVGLLAATASSASATTTLSPTSPAPPPLTLSVYAGYGAESALFGCNARAQKCARKKLSKTLPFTAITSNDSTLVATGRKIEKTTKQAAGERTEIEARLKHPRRLNERPKPGRPTVRIKVVATDEFGQTATDKIKVKLVRNKRWSCPSSPTCG